MKAYSFAAIHVFKSRSRLYYIIIIHIKKPLSFHCSPIFVLPLPKVSVPCNTLNLHTGLHTPELIHTFYAKKNYTFNGNISDYLSYIYRLFIYCLHMEDTFDNLRCQCLSHLIELNVCSSTKEGSKSGGPQD